MDCLNGSLSKQMRACESERCVSHRSFSAVYVFVKTFSYECAHAAGHSLPTRLAREESRSLASSFPPGWMAIWGGGRGGSAVCAWIVGFKRSPRASKPGREIKLDMCIRWEKKKVGLETTYFTDRNEHMGVSATYRHTDIKKSNETQKYIWLDIHRGLHLIKII